MGQSSKCNRLLIGLNWKRLLMLFITIILMAGAVFAIDYGADAGTYEDTEPPGSAADTYSDEYIGIAPQEEYNYDEDIGDAPGHSYEANYSYEDSIHNYEYSPPQYNYENEYYTSEYPEYEGEPETELYIPGGYIGIAPASFIEVTLSGPAFFGPTGLQHHIDNTPPGWTLYVRLNFAGGTFAQLNILTPGAHTQAIVVDGGQRVVIDTNVSGTNMQWIRSFADTSLVNGQRHFVVTNGTLELRDVTLRGMRDGELFQGGVLVDGENAVFIMSHESLHSTEVNTVISTPRIFDTTSELYGGGVEVRNGGRFIMQAGTIGDLAQARYGACVSVRGVSSGGQRSTFEMRGGSLHRSQTRVNVPIPMDNLGGGVHVADGASFIMIDCDDTPTTPQIYHNQSRGRGGGVAIVGSHGTQPSTFTMYGGIVGIGTSRNPLGTPPELWTGNFAYYEGGGVAVFDGGRFTMQGGHIYGNSSGISVIHQAITLPTYSRGGGVFVSGATSRSYMYGGYIGMPVATHNRSNGAARGGGVAVNNGARFYLRGGTVWHNFNATHTGVWHSDCQPYRYGAGVHVDNGSHFIMSSGYVSNNVSHYGGGGVYVDNSSTVTMTGGTIRSNTASHDGGGVMLTRNAIFNMSGGTIGGTYVVPAISANANTATRGGGVAVYRGATFNMTVPVSGPGGSILGNSASGGGGVVVHGGDGVASTFTMHTGTIGGNHGTGGSSGPTQVVSGGGVLVFGQHATFTMHDGNIRDNRSPIWSGGGVNATNFSNFIMNGGYIQNNTAVISGGGGVSVRYDATFTMNNNSIVRYNESILGSGVLSYNRGLFIMNNGTINSNVIHATSSFGGGGIGVIANGTAYMHGGTVRDHVLGIVNNDGGGGVWVGMVSGFTPGIHLTGLNRFTMTGGYIINNIANNGGGVLVEGGNPVVGGEFTHNHFIMTGGHIRGNEARQDGGGFIIRDNGILQMSGGTIGGEIEAHANIANGNGGGVNLTGGARFNPINTGTKRIRGNSAVNGGGAWIAANAYMTMPIGASGLQITHNNATQMGGGIFTERFQYADPLTHLPPTVTGAGVAYSNLTLHSVTFGNNTSYRRYWPPENATAAISTGAFVALSTSQPEEIATIRRHPLNNNDINFRIDLQQFDFLKTDEQLFNTPPVISLLAGAQFKIFRNVDPGVTMGTGAGYVVTYDQVSGILDPRWEEVMFTGGPILTSGGYIAQSTTAAVPISFMMDPRHHYQLVEILAPPTHQVPMGQWRISYDRNGDIFFEPVLIGGIPSPLLIRSTSTNLAGITHPLSPRSNLFYLGNWLQIQLPHTGGSGIMIIAAIGGIFISMAMFVMFAVLVAKKKSVLASPYKHRNPNKR